MKKVFVFMLAAGTLAMTSCVGNSAQSEASVVDSTAVDTTVVDSTVTVEMDSASVVE